VPGSTASASNNGHWLVVGVNWIGDAIMSMPALQAWRRAHPSARLTLLVRPGLAPLWRMHAAPDAVQVYTEPFAALRAAARAIRAIAPDRAVMFPNSFRSALPPFLARVPERVGRPGHWRRALLTRVKPAPVNRAHQALEYFDLLDVPRPAGAVEHPLLAVPAEVAAAQTAVLASLPRPLLGVMPGAARGPAKRWPAPHFAAVAARWHAETGGGVVAMGAPGDIPLAEEILRGVGEGLNLAGRTALAEWAAALAACDAVVCNDSGGMHLAAALGRPVVAVFGATDPSVTGPLGPRARVVQDDGPRARAIARDDAAAEKRLAALSPERIYGELRSLLHRGEMP